MQSLGSTQQAFGTIFLIDIHNPPPLLWGGRRRQNYELKVLGYVRNVKDMISVSSCRVRYKLSWRVMLVVSSSKALCSPLCYQRAGFWLD